jgi:hypothetical protein
MEVYGSQRGRRLGMNRRTFLKGVGALALIPFIPEMVRPEPSYYTATQLIKDRAEFMDALKYDLARSLTYGDYEPKTDMTGLMTIPHDGTRYKVRYTVTQDGTDAEIMGVE